MSKTYTLIIKTTDNEETFEDIQEFIYNNFSYVGNAEVLYEDGNNYKTLLETHNDFNYETFEDFMDFHGYPVEFLEVEG